MIDFHASLKMSIYRAFEVSAGDPFGQLFDRRQLSLKFCFFSSSHLGLAFVDLATVITTTIKIKFESNYKGAER
jgi:hypothetical protein